MKRLLSLYAQRVLFVLSASMASNSLLADFSVDVARRVLQNLGADLEGTTRRCAGCHNPTAPKIREWSNSASQIANFCLNNYLNNDGGPAQARYRIDCIRENPEDPDSKFSARKIGLYSAAAHLPFFKKLFSKAYGDELGRQKHGEFMDQVMMPRNENLMSEAEFSEVESWFKASEPHTPHLETLLRQQAPPPQKCSPFISEDLKTYLNQRSQNSWASKNAEQGLQMFGCSLGNKEDPIECFRELDVATGAEKYPLVGEDVRGVNWSDDFPIQDMRVLRQLDFATNFWMRSSVDGRFVANGMKKAYVHGGKNYYSRIDDLASPIDQQGKARHYIYASSWFDPYFFPDHSSFIFQDRENRFCRMSTLENPNLYFLDYASHQGCTIRGQVGLYQSIGASLHGGDYFGISGDFAMDGGYDAVQDPQWGGSSYLSINRIIHTGTSHDVSKTYTVWTPYHGDFHVSPSTDLLVSRRSNIGSSSLPISDGYSISHLTFNPRLPDEKSIERKEWAQVCTFGGKASFSFDERFLVTYAPVRPEDYKEYGFASPGHPKFVEIIGTHNIILIDLLDGSSHRLTRMARYQNARFPHFRSDGWIYFLVTDDIHKRRYVVASNAAIRLSRHSQP